MTPRNFPPADQCTPDDLDAIADLVVSDPSASWDLAGSRKHIEALCRRYQALAQELSQSRDDVAVWHSTAERNSEARLKTQHDLDVATLGVAALERTLAAATNDLDAARKAIADREDEIARVNNARQAEVNEAAAQRERADEAETSAEIFEMVARAALDKARGEHSAEPLTLAEIVRAVDGRIARALQRATADNARLTQQLEDTAMLLNQQSETRRLDDQLRSTCRTVTGKDLGEVNILLDAELAANPDVGPLHHARDQRDHQEDTTP